MNKKEPFHVRVTREFDDGVYNYMSAYTIEAPDYHDAEKEACKRFCEDFGAPYDKTKAYTFNKQQP